MRCEGNNSRNTVPVRTVFNDEMEYFIYSSKFFATRYIVATKMLLYGKTCQKHVKTFYRHTTKKDGKELF